MRRERRESYSGPAEVNLEDGDKLGDATVYLGSWVTIINDKGTTGTRGWSGSLSGLPDDALPDWMTAVILRLPDGREAKAWLRGSQLDGNGPPPFDTT